GRRATESRPIKKTCQRNALRVWLTLHQLEDRLTPTTLFPDMLGLHYPADWNQTYPSGFDQFTPPVENVTLNGNEPVFTDWTRTAGPDQTIAITGDMLSAYPASSTDFGKDAEFYFYGQTGSTQTAPRNGSILRLDSARAAVTLSDQLAQDSMYMLWPGNDNG